MVFENMIATTARQVLMLPERALASGRSLAESLLRLDHLLPVRRIMISGLVASGFVLTGCAQFTSSGFSFAAQTGQYEPEISASRTTHAQFADGDVVLVAPSGYCIDQTMLRQEGSEGFALLPRCNLMHGSSWFGRNRAAIITATIGKAASNGAPRTADIARTAEGAKLVYYDDKGVLPLVRLHWPNHSTAGGAGASPEHWRGAFVLNDHLVLLALYAPKGSDLLGQAGADVLTEMTLRSLNATTATIGQAPADTPPVQAEAHENAPAQTAAQSATSGPRPKTRPADISDANLQGQRAETGPRDKKPSLRERIAGLFQ